MARSAEAMTEPTPTLAPYASPEQRDTRLLAAAARVGGAVEIIGQSVEGRPILAARLPRLGAAGGPRLLSLANIHGPEYVSGEVALGVVERAMTAPMAELRKRAELWVVPCLNPDGYARVWERSGRGPIAELRPNARGVDLNRNFPLPTGRRRLRLPGAGSDQPGAATYVGPHPLSEPETSAIDRLCREQRFVAAVSGHSFMGTLIPAHVADAPAYQRYQRLCEAFAAAQPLVGYARLASRFFDTFTGELEDYLHHELGTLAVCLETFPAYASFGQHVRAPSLFWRFNPRDPAPWVNNDVPGIAAYFAAALQLYEAAPSW